MDSNVRPLSPVVTRIPFGPDAQLIAASWHTDRETVLEVRDVNGCLLFALATGASLAKYQLAIHGDVLVIK